MLGPIIKRLIGSGLPFGPNVLLTVRGRTSGQPRTFPVAILEHEGAHYVQSPWGEEPQGSLLISKSVTGPQGAEAVLY